MIMNSSLLIAKSATDEVQNLQLLGIDRFYSRFLAGEVTSDEFSNILDLHIEFSNH